MVTYIDRIWNETKTQQICTLILAYCIDFYNVYGLTRPLFVKNLGKRALGLHITEQGSEPHIVVLFSQSSCFTLNNSRQEIKKKNRFANAEVDVNDRVMDTADGILLFTYYRA